MKSPSPHFATQARRISILLQEFRDGEILVSERLPGHVGAARIPTNVAVTHVFTGKQYATGWSANRVAGIEAGKPHPVWKPVRPAGES